MVRNIFFFFQAEDGIRDYKVTGVQTCALPIFTDSAGTGDAGWGTGARSILGTTSMTGARGASRNRSEERRGGEEGRSRWAPDHLKKKKNEREGGGDCRERGEVSGASGVGCVAE